MGPGAEFEGLLRFRGTVRVEGNLVGDVIAEGRLVVSPGARVRARIVVDELVVGGAVEGDVQASRRVEIQSTGRLVGRVQCPRLAVAEGALLEGPCETGTGARPSAASATSSQAAESG